MTKALALSYAASGVPIFPCRAADEPSGKFDDNTGEELFFKSKTPLISAGFKGATKNARVINVLWDRTPSAMVGIPTGEQIGAFVLDVDVHKDKAGNVINGYETLAALEAKHGELPPTATVKTAGGGEHRYFSHVPGVRNRGKLGRGLDLRGSGGYVIAPGSVTADGAGYHWIDYDGDGIPPVADAPQWLLDLVLPPPAPAAPAASFDYTPGNHDAYVEGAVEAELSELARCPAGSRGEAVNKSAFSLGTLVGAGALARSDAESGLFSAAQANGVVAKDGEREIRLKIKRGLDAGIKQPRAMPEPTYSDNGVDYSGFVANAIRPPPPDTPDTQPAPTEEEQDPIEYKLEAVADLESLTYPGGLVEDLIDWIVSSAERPCRALAMAAVLPFVATLCGPRYSTTNRDTRPNIYTVALAESGFGKDHARSQIKRLLMEDHGVFEGIGGPARIMSASALREVLEANQSVVCQIDEFGGFVREITDRKAGSHQRAISTDLRDYYSASATYFEGAAYRGTPPKRIYNPVLCIHGTSTPDQFWSALSSASAEDGLLPRLILFHITGAKPPTVKPQVDVRRVPGWLLERMAKAAGIDVVSRRVGKMPIGFKSSGAIKPKVVPWTPDAEAILASVKETIVARETQVAPEARPFLQRIVENAIKLALIVAVGRDPDNPVINDDVFEWAAGVAWTCAASMLEQIGEHLADNQREANYKRIAAIIRKAANRGITEGRLADRCKAIDARQREEILKDLLLSGKVTFAPTPNKTGPKAKVFLWM